jgi:hypothetical protein
MGGLDDTWGKLQKAKNQNCSRADQFFYFPTKSGLVARAIRDDFDSMKCGMRRIKILTRCDFDWREVGFE